MNRYRWVACAGIPIALHSFVTFAAPEEASSLPSWKFGEPGALAEWVPNPHIDNLRRANGVVEFDTAGSDPCFHCKTLSIRATARQYAVIRLRSDRPGIGELFWSGQLEGEYGGLTERKKNRFAIQGTGEWEEIPVFPFWRPEGTVRQLRLDLFEGAHFRLDSVEIREGFEGVPLTEGPLAWTLNGDLSSWEIHPNADTYFAPPLDLSTDGLDWATIRLRSTVSGMGAAVWATGQARGLQSEEFEIIGDGRMRSYPIEMRGLASWKSPLLAFGIRLPGTPPENVFVESVEIGKNPNSPAELRVRYFGFENAPNRAGDVCRVLTHVTNAGSETGLLRNLRIEVPEGIEAIGDSEFEGEREIGFHELTAHTWKIRAKVPGTYRVRLLAGAERTTLSATAALSFSPAPDVPPSAAVPAPVPVSTSIDVCAYYFPGWNSAAKWDCVRDTAPIRKPVLGYYDESNTECVDWQIKWAVESGISCFLVDWYWVRGNQHLTHWFEAYKKARHRDPLDVAIMWANHNPPGSHSREDWREVTRHWIDHYFSMETYYRIDDKPAVFLWDPRLIRTDLGGSEEVRAAFDESQEMARDAGFAGIEFVALHDHDSRAQADRLSREGYAGATNYHEWGEAPRLGNSPNRMAFEDLVATASETWRARDERCGELTYYPTVDTGWDARPWHGKKARVIHGRTPDRFERLLTEAESYCKETKKPFVVLGPINEWGEGSYIEPCVEFGFEMYDRIRKVFAADGSAPHPVHLAPADIGLGPYDFPVPTNRSRWTFDQGLEGWRGKMNVANLRAAEGALRFQTTSRDPALVVSTPDLDASKLGRLRIRMSVTANEGEGPVAGRFFWAPRGTPLSQTTSLGFSLPADGDFHEVVLDLDRHPRWRGSVGSIRLDPCDRAEIDVVIDELSFKE